MKSVKLQTYSWISSSLGMPENSNGLFQKQVKDGITMAELFTELAHAYPEFRRLVFDPDKGQMSDQVMVIYNNKLLQMKDIRETRITGQDRITLSPILAGG